MNQPTEKTRNSRKAPASKPATPKRSRSRFSIDKKSLKKLRLVAVAYSHVERDQFATEEAYQAEVEVEGRAEDLLQVLEELGQNARGYPADPYFLTNLLVDQPDLVINLVDTLRGRDALQTAIPAALELSNIHYTGAGMRGLVIGNDRRLFKELLEASNIPTPPYQFIRRRGTRVDPAVGLPVIVKLTESGGSVGIDNQAVKESLEEANEKVDSLIGEYHMPVIAEKFVAGPEITAVVFDDGRQKHVFLGQKKFRTKPDGKYYFTSLESYDDPLSYTYRKINDAKLEDKLIRLTRKAFEVLHNRDYAKFDIRIDQETGAPYFTDCNPNTAFGPGKGLPFTEVLDLHGIAFKDVLISLLSKHARQLPG